MVLWINNWELAQEADTPILDVAPISHNNQSS